MTAPAARAPRRPAAGDAGARSTELRLASLHLRTGLLTLARAELESMAGNGTLDDQALLDLGEVRWRTGDLSGAGDAAAAYLDTGHEATLAFLIAAEAQAALGRPAEARRLANRALETGEDELDGLFAGMPRATLWPDADADRSGEGGLDPGGSDGSDEVLVTAVDAGPAGVSSRPDSTPSGASAIAAVTHQPVALPDGQTQLDAARTALEAGDLDTAAVRLALVLRLAPRLAPAVLEAAASAPGPLLDLVRGDAFRLLGREIAARRLFLGTIEALDDRGHPGDGASTEPVALATGAVAAPTGHAAAPRSSTNSASSPADGQVPLPFGVPSDGLDPSTSNKPEAS